MMTMKKSPSRAKIDLSKPKIDILCQKLSERVEEILDFFGIEYEQYDNRIAAACPIHDGDKTDALTIFTSGDNVVGNWYCWTNHCEKEYVNTMLGTAFVACASNLLKKSKPTPKGISRDMVRQGLQRPVDFYLKRGFLEETLDTFDVGICINSNKLMYNRVVVPVYDDSHQYMVGCVGRSLEDNPSTQKWINSKGFNSGAHLYNYWMAKKEISRTETIVLVEGQGDVWRLWEAGIRNAVGMFGCHLTDYQQISIEKSGAMNIVVLTDNDEAGIKAASSIKEKCGRLFNLHFPQLPKKDVGDMSTDEIEEQLKPQIASIL